MHDFRMAPRFSDMSFIRLALSMTLDAVGMTTLARRFEEAGGVQAVDQLALQGLLALWRPSVTE